MEVLIIVLHNIDNCNKHTILLLQDSLLICYCVTISNLNWANLIVSILAKFIPVQNYHYIDVKILTAKCSQWVKNMGF